MINTEVLDHDLLLPMRGIGKKSIPFSGNCLETSMPFSSPGVPFSFPAWGVCYVSD